LVIVISFAQFQSDHILQQPLYIEKLFNNVSCFEQSFFLLFIISLKRRHKKGAKIKAGVLNRPTNNSAFEKSQIIMASHYIDWE